MKTLLGKKYKWTQRETNLTLLTHSFYGRKSWFNVPMAIEQLWQYCMWFFKHYSENDLYVRIGACNKNISSHLIIVALSVLDSFPCLQFDRFHEIARVFCSLGFYLQNTTSLDQSKKITMLVLSYVNKHSFLLPQVYGLSLIPKTRPTSPFSLRKSRLSM